MADAGAGDQHAGASHLIGGFSVSAAGAVVVEVVVVAGAEFAERDALTHFRKFCFSAPTSATFPRILKNAVPVSSEAIPPIIRPSFSGSPFSGSPERSTTATSPRVVASG